MKFGNHITGWSYCNIKRWRIRIEDAFLISDNVRAHLLNEAQKKVNEIEYMMPKKSVLAHLFYQI
jgi:hypothetical protein